MCPSQLGKLLNGENYDKIKKLEAEIVAISHESVAINKMLSEKYQVEFPNLSDVSRDTIRKYDVVDPIFGIAKISFFVINKDGVITWKSTKHSNVDPNDLPKFELLLEAVQKAR